MLQRKMDLSNFGTNLVTDIFNWSKNYWKINFIIISDTYNLQTTNLYLYGSISSKINYQKIIELDLIREIYQIGT